MVQAEKVVRRFTGTLLTSDWLIKVRRGWLSLLKPRVTDWESVVRILRNLQEFVINLREQVMFERPSLGIRQKDPRLSKDIDALENAISGEFLHIYTWDETEKAQMLERYRQDFEEASRGWIVPSKPIADRQLTFTQMLDQILVRLRKEAKTIEKMRAENPQQTEEEWGTERPTEFDLYGMKIIVDDKSVSAKDLQQYIHYLKKAYTLLRSKGFGKAWYGNVFIQCEYCGGGRSSESQVAGWFRHTDDIISIFSRPSEYVVKVVVHELGHRYWFKQMSKAQRDHFTDLVQVGLEGTFDIHEQVAVAKLAVQDFIDKMDRTTNTKLLYSLGTDLNIALEKPRDHFMQLFERASTQERSAILTRLSDVMFPRKQKIMMRVNQLWEKPETKDEIKPMLKEWINAFVTETRDIVQDMSKPILPVSQYGRTNIQEAFAEVFAYYVLEKEMTRDQVDSFKSVMRIARRSPTPSKGVRG